MTTSEWWLAAVTLGLGLISPLAARPLLYRLGAFDVPNARSSHSRATLRGGGIAPMLALSCAAVLGLALDVRDADHILVIVAVAVSIGLVGLVEDVKGLPIAIRAGAQLFIGAVAAGVMADVVDGPWIAVPILAVCFAAYVNFVNFMDGVNAISGSHGLVVGLSFALLGHLEEAHWMTLSGVLIAAAFTAFLPWNLLPPGMFLGDVGSYLLGGVIAAVAVTGLLAGLNPVAVLAPMSIYVADTVWTIGRRAARGEVIFEAHRSHAYQRLTDHGLSHIHSALVVSAFTAIAGILGVLAATGEVSEAPAALLVAATSATYLLVPRLLDRIVPQTSGPEG